MDIFIPSSRFREDFSDSIRNPVYLPGAPLPAFPLWIIILRTTGTFSPLIWGKDPPENDFCFREYTPSLQAYQFDLVSKTRVVLFLFPSPFLFGLKTLLNDQDFHCPLENFPLPPPLLRIFRSPWSLLGSIPSLMLRTNRIPPPGAGVLCCTKSPIRQLAGALKWNHVAALFTDFKKRLIRLPPRFLQTTAKHIPPEESRSLEIFSYPSGRESC